MKKYSLNDPEEEEAIVRIMCDAGIYLQYDVFNYPYFLVEVVRKTNGAGDKLPIRRKRKRNHNLTSEDVIQIKKYRDSGKTIREIAAFTGYSVGAVHSAIKKYEHL